MRKIPFTYIRGGTSRAVFFEKKNLPDDKNEWNAIFKAVLGLPPKTDGPKSALPKQLPTSKIAVISPSGRPGYDVEYHFFQMNDLTGIADDRGTCGNMSSAVGPFAADHGLAAVKEGENTLRVYNVNTKKCFLTTFFVKDGRAETAGNVFLPGLAESGSPVTLDFISPGGGYSGKLFPTGHKLDRIDCGVFGKKEATVIDCVNPIAVVRAADVGMTGLELRNEEITKDAMTLLQMIRGKTAALLGLVKNWEEAAVSSTYIPHLAVVAKSSTYRTSTGEEVVETGVDFCARAVFTGLHPTFPAGGAVAAAAAACIPGTVLDAVTEKEKPSGPVRKIVIGHPAGCISVPLEISGENIKMGTLIRTARHLFEGELYFERD